MSHSLAWLDLLKQSGVIVDWKLQGWEQRDGVDVANIAIQFPAPAVEIVGTMTVTPEYTALSLGDVIVFDVPQQDDYRITPSPDPYLQQLDEDQGLR